MSVDSINAQKTDSSTSYIGSFTRGSLKLAQATTLAVAGVGLMIAGVGGAYLTTVKLNQFYFEEGDNAQGYGDIPGFVNLCEKTTEFMHSKTGFPEQDSKFCESIGEKPFADQEGIYGPASLATTLGLSALSYIGSLYSFLGGMSLVSRSIETFTSIL